MTQKMATDQTMRILSRSCRTLLMQPLRQSEHQDALDLIQDAAGRGDNVGIDEMPEEVLNIILSFGSGWSFHSVSSPGKLMALVFVSASRFSRSQHRTLCSIHIITSSELSTRDVRGDLLDIALQLASAMGRGFSACALEVFVTCTDHLLGYEQQGLVVTCVVPKAGRVPGQKGYVNSYILYKRFDHSEIPICLDDAEFNSLELPDNFIPTVGTLPSFLPAEYTLSNGTVVIIRGMTLEEVPLFYQTLVDVSRKGQGYGWDELMDYKYFLKWYIDNFYNLTIQERDGQRRIIGFQNFGPSNYSRSWNNSYLSDGNNVLMPEFRGKGFGAEVADLNSPIALDCGFGSAFGDTCVTNLSSILGMTKVGFINTGVIPRAIFFENKGWVGVVTIYKPFGEDAERLNKELKRNGKTSKL